MPHQVNDEGFNVSVHFPCLTGTDRHTDIVKISLVGDIFSRT